jgi:alpha-beta hydrolase superfamily lysophospholipase
MTITDFNTTTLELEDDYEGRVIATLIESPNNTPGNKPVLYLHGFNDYFFQTHVAEQFNQNGYNFYALDLRKYGRSLLSHQHPNYCRSITEYFEEINRSVEFIQKQIEHKIILLGHSTGGLIASVYLNIGKYRQNFDRLILNSPFLDFNVNLFQRLFLLPLAGPVSAIFPFAARKKPFSHLYGASISRSKYGEWDYNKEWKPMSGFPAYFKWIYAVNRAQKKIRKHSSIDVPILILHAERSSRPDKWRDILKRSDMVLDVKHIRKYGVKLGPDVSLLAIDDAIHDIYLSQPKVREEAFNKTFDWLRITDPVTSE